MYALVPCVLDDKADILRLRKVDSGNDIRGSGDVDRVAGVVAELAGLCRRRERIARPVLGPGEPYLAGVGIATEGVSVDIS